MQRLGLRLGLAAVLISATQPISVLLQLVYRSCLRTAASLELKPSFFSAMILKWLRRPTSHRLMRAVLANEPDKVELMGQGMSLKVNKWPGSLTALHAAALSGCWQALPALLAAAAKEGISIDSRTDSPDLDAAFAALLLELDMRDIGGGLGLDYQRFEDGGGMTPLHLACCFGRLEMIPILLDHGASPALTSRSRPWSGWLEPDLKPDALGLSLLHKQSAELLAAVQLLLQHGADPLCEVQRSRLILVAHPAVPLEVRRCMVRCAMKQHRKGRGRFDLDNIPLIGIDLIADNFLQVLEESPLEVATLVIEEMLATKRVNISLDLWTAAEELKPKAVRALVPYAQRQVFDKPIAVTGFRYRMWAAGPCRIQRLVHKLAYSPEDYDDHPGWEKKAAAVLSYLIEAGMGPSVYPVATVHYSRDLTKEVKEVRNYDPLAGNPSLLQDLPRMVRLVLQQPAWKPANHRRFPPAFQAAARCFLRVAAASALHGQQRQPTSEVEQAGCCLSYVVVAAAGARQRQHRQEASEQPEVSNIRHAGCCLADLPVPLLEKVLGLAAYPLSAWL